MLRIVLVTIVVWFADWGEVTAQHSLRFQNSYFLTGQPIFGAGYHRETKGRITFGAGLEFGRYAHRSSEFSNTLRTSYSIQGVALVPEMRVYLSRFDDTSRLPKGLFIAGFGHVRFMAEYASPGMNAGAEYRQGHSLGGGLSAGYRTACGDIPFYFEVVAGYGRADARWQQGSTMEDVRRRAGSYDTATTLYRLELVIGYALGSGSVQSGENLR